MNPVGPFIQPAIRGHFETHFQYTGENRLFSPPECDAIIALAAVAGYGAAAIGNPDGSRVDASYRAADVALVPYSPASTWLYERITQRMQGANQHYGFALTGLLEDLQVIRYETSAQEAIPAGHYDWHQDFGADYMSRRKISMTAQLSAPEDYDGCRLTLMTPNPTQLEHAYVERGAGVIFPSWSPHCVSSITRGVRYALVAWLHGEPFR